MKWTRAYTGAAVAMGIVLLLVAVTLRAVTPEQLWPDSGNLRVHTGSVGHPVKTPNVYMDITRVQMARSVEDSSSLLTSRDGLYVLLTYSLHCVNCQGSQSWSKLTLNAPDGTVYEPQDAITGNGTLSLENPGFQSTGMIAFEVDPRNLRGSTLFIEPTQLFTTEAEAIHFRLGITQEAVDKAMKSRVSVKFQRSAVSVQ